MLGPLVVWAVLVLGLRGFVVPVVGPVVGLVLVFCSSQWSTWHEVAAAALTALPLLALVLRVLILRSTA